MFEFTEANIANLIATNQSRFCTSYDALIPNCYTAHDNECDVLAIRKSGICDEFEIKISRSDFLNDKKKIVNYRKFEFNHGGNASVDMIWNNDHQLIPHKKRKKLVAPWQKLKNDALRDGDMTPNYFWYVVAEGVATVDDMPDFAGLAIVNGDGSIRTVKQPEKLHKNKLTDLDKYHFIRKLAYRFWEYRVGNR